MENPANKTVIIRHYFMLFLLLNLIVLIRFVKILNVEVKCLSAQHYIRCPSGAACVVI